MIRSLTLRFVRWRERRNWIAWKRWMNVRMDLTRRAYDSDPYGDWPGPSARV